jgi:hypothetical protein
MSEQTNSDEDPCFLWLGAMDEVKYLQLEI